MSSAEFIVLRESMERIERQNERIERLLEEWVRPTIAERNRQMLTADPEARKAGNRELLARKRRELKAAR